MNERKATEKVRLAEESLRARGVRLTPQRVAILEVLAGAGEPLTALACHERLTAAHPRVSLDTVYRNLFMLAAWGLVSQINLQSREAALFEFQGPEHHHHAVCLGCGSVQCLSPCPPNALRALGDAAGFAAVNHVFEMYGYCEECQRAGVTNTAAG